MKTETFSPTIQISDTSSITTEESDIVGRIYSLRIIYLLAIAAKWGYNEADRKDMVQSFFLKKILNLSVLSLKKIENGGISYIRKAFVNFMKTEWNKKNNSQKTINIDGIKENGVDIFLDFTTHQERAMYRKAILEKFSERYAIIFDLYIDGFTVEEIQKKTKYKSVYTAKHRIREYIKQIIAIRN